MIPLFKVLMHPNAHEAVKAVFDSGMIAQGPRVDDFEIVLKAMLGVPSTSDLLTVNSCTSALDLALHLLGIGPGDDEVVTTAMTCTATNGALVHRGIRPIWADINPYTGLIDPKSVGERITSRTKAIIAVDWAGVPCDYDALRQFGLPIIEDAAHAFLATRDGVPIARSGGDIICWSFQAIKTLTTGDGGAIMVPAAHTERARLLRWFGLDRRSGDSFRCSQDIKEVGFKYHMNDIAAAIGLQNCMLSVDAIEKHREHAKQYSERLAGCRHLRVPFYVSGASYWIYTITVDDRATFETTMKAAGVATSQVHTRNDKHTAFARAAGNTGAPRPGQEYFSEHQVSIPVGWWLSQNDIDRICDAVITWDATR